MRIPHLFGRSSRSVLFATVVASSLGACGKKEEPAPTPAPSVNPAAPIDSGESESRPRRDIEPAAPSVTHTLAAPILARVPVDAPLVLVVKPLEIWNTLGYSSLLDRYGAFVGDSIGPIGELIGADPTRPEGWAKLGMDLAKPAGVWLTDFRPSGVVTFIGLTDRKVFEAKASELATKAEVALTTEQVGAATLLTRAGSDRFAGLVTDDAVYVVTLYAGTGAVDLAREIATRTKAQSLVGKGGFEELAGTVPSPDGGLYLRFAELIEREAEDQPLLKHLFKGLSEVVAGLDASADGLDVTARIPLGDGATAATLYKRNDGLLPVLKLAASQPLFSLGGTVDAKVATDILKTVAVADGIELDEVREQLKAQFGFDLDSDVLARLDGRLGFVLTGDLLAALRAGDPTSTLGGTLIIGLSDAEAIKALLAKVGAIPALAEMATWNEENATLAFKLVGREVSVFVADGYLVVSTDPETKQRIAGTTTYLEQAINPLLKERLSRPGLGTIFTFEHALVGGWVYAMTENRVGLMAPIEIGESEETQKIRAELKALTEEISALRTKVEATRITPLVEGLAKLGTWAQTLAVTDKHVELSFGIYPRGATLAEAVGGLVDFAMIGADTEPSADEMKLRDLENRRWELESKLWKAPEPVEFAPDE